MQASDALLILKKAVGQNLVCPLWACDTDSNTLLQAADMEMRSSVDALLSQWAAEGQVAAAGWEVG